ncbi:MAG: hypothetical protein AAF639_36595 [Chloroflexota bacterium]
MIELAPNHKFGLPVDNPVLLAGGTIGYGEAVYKGVQLEKLGAVVVGPIMRYGRAGTEEPRVAETNSGFVLNTGLQNRGVSAVVKKISKLWPKLGCPVIAQVGDSDRDALTHVATRLNRVDGLYGIELLLPQYADEDLVRRLVQAATRTSDFPVWVKLPVETAVMLAPAAMDAGADGLVVAQPPTGTAFRNTTQGFRRKDNGQHTDEPTVTGSLFGPLAFTFMLNALVSVDRLQITDTLIACGGIHTLTQAQQALDVGAKAVQIDGAVWVEPGLPAALVDGLTVDS